MTISSPVQRSEPLSITGLLRLVRDSIFQWSSGHAFVYAAALAYYTIFSIVPLLVLLVDLTVYFAGVYNLERQLLTLLTRQLGPLEIAQFDMVSTTEQLITLVRRQAGAVPAAFLADMLTGRTPTAASGTAAVVSVLFLIYGASTVFHQLLNSLNAMYGLPEAYNTLRHGILYYLIARLFSAAAVVIVGLLFLLLLASSLLLAVLPPTPLELLAAAFPGTQLLTRFVLTPVAAVFFFAFFFKYLPHGRMRWRDVLPGSLLTVLLIVAGNRVIGFYLERIFGATLYGTSGTVILFLIWIYYISMIILFGGKFIALYCERFGVPITPKRRLLPSHTAPAT